MLELLEKTLAIRRGTVCFAMIDIDNFHEISDTLGRAGAAAMLANIAERLNSGLLPGARLGRLGDDEFAVDCFDRGPANRGGGRRQARRVPRRTDLPGSSCGGSAPGSGSRWRPPTAPPATNCSGVHRWRCGRPKTRSAVALCGASCRRSTKEHAERRFVLRELETAIQNEAFEVHYQPVVAAEGGGMVGVEALLRWTHPTRGVIAPSSFIPLAEESGLMNRLGELVLRRAAEGRRAMAGFVRRRQLVAGADPQSRARRPARGGAR